MSSQTAVSLFSLWQGLKIYQHTGRDITQWYGEVEEEEKK